MSGKQKSIIVQKMLNDIIKVLDKQGGYIINVYFSSIDKDLQTQIQETPEGWQFFVGSIKPCAGEDSGMQFIGCESVVYFLSPFQENPVELFTIQSMNTFVFDDPSTSSARASYNISDDLVTDADLPKLKLYTRKFFDRISNIIKENWISSVLEPIKKTAQSSADVEQETQQKPAQAAARAAGKVNADTIAAMPGIDEMGDDDFPASRVPVMTHGSGQNTAPRASAPAQVAKEKPRQSAKKQDEAENIDDDDGDAFKLDIPTIPRIDTGGKDVPTLKGSALRANK